MTQSRPSFIPLHPHDDLDQVKRQTKELLRRYHAGDADAVTLVRQHYTLRAGEDPAALRLSDAQLVVARAAGFASWPKLKAFVEARMRARGKVIAAPFDAQVVRTARPLHIGWIDPDGDGDPAGGGESSPGSTTAGGAVVDVPPSRVWFVEPLVDLSTEEWTGVIDEVCQRRVPGLYTRGRADDDVMPLIATLDHLLFLDLSRSTRLTDAGLAHLAKLPSLEYLYLRNCPNITDVGLAVLAALPKLRVVHLRDAKRVTGAGVTHLAAHEHLELVTLDGTAAGDDALRHLAGKPNLTHLSLSDQTTDAGMAMLPQFPALAAWRDDRPTHKIDEYRPPSDSFLWLAGFTVTDEGLRHLEQLEGVTNLDLDFWRNSLQRITDAGVASVMKMPRVDGLPIPGRLLTDGVCEMAADLPRLKALSFWDAVATDRGVAAVARSKSIETLHLAKFHNLTPRGLAALRDLKTLQALHVGSRGLPDDGLACLKDFAGLTNFWTANENIFTDEAFKHIGRIPRLEKLVNMYCRRYESGKLVTATTDRSTEYVAQSRTLKNYSAWGSFVGDRSCELLSRMTTLESLTFQTCPNMTDDGVRMLARLPKLRSLDLLQMPAVTPAALTAFDRSVQINYHPD